MKDQDELIEVLIDITRSQDYHDDTFVCPVCLKKLRGTSCQTCNEIIDQEAFDLYDW